MERGLPSDPHPTDAPPLTLAAARIALCGPLTAMAVETVPLGAAVGRALAEAAVAPHDQPPFPAAAMDGFAVRHTDVSATLTLVGEAAAGHPFGRALRPGEAVRIGTGAPMPDGADHVLILEEAALHEARLTATADQPRARNVRRAGRDFARGDTLLPAGTAVRPRQLGLLAAGNCMTVTVRRRPVVAILTSGDELVDPGTPLGPAQIVDSASVGLPALVEEWGGQGRWIGRAPDDLPATADLWRSAQADLIVAVGGASVGHRDLLRAGLNAAGGQVEWAGVAIRPGKPSWAGRLGDTPVLGLPGNPAAALVAARLLLKPMLDRWLGLDWADEPLTAELATPLPPNGWREAHERAVLRLDGATTRLEPVVDGDSSRLSPFFTADALMVRPPNAPAAEVGERVAYRRI